MIYKSIVQLRSQLLVFLTHTLALPLLQLLRNEKSFPYSKEELAAFPKNSLGYELQNFLGHKHLELLPHYVRHDMKHILLNYDTTDEGEVCLQCFMLGNKHVSFPVIATVVYGYVTMPEHWVKFWLSYKRGQEAAYISDWDWFGIMEMETDILRKRISGNQKLKTKKSN